MRQLTWCAFLSKILYELLSYCFLLETLCPFLPEFLLATIRNYFPASNRLPCSSQKSISRVVAATDYITTWVLVPREWLKIVERNAHYWNLCFFFIDREVIEKVIQQRLLLFSFILGSDCCTAVEHTPHHPEVLLVHILLGWFLPPSSAECN